MNTLAIRYFKTRYESLYGKASLNARYQVLGMVLAYTYILLMPYFEGPIYALMDSGYFLSHCTNCAFSSLFLMFLHKSIRKSALTLFRNKR
ncbi:hypothetical protein PENTCL1PPCAC_14716, partial [Pristionchus entomophagus]